jgi:hypothetical protein
MQEARQHGSPYLSVCHICPSHVPFIMRGCIERKPIAVEGVSSVHHWPLGWYRYGRGCLSQIFESTYEILRRLCASIGNPRIGEVRSAKGVLVILPREAGDCCGIWVGALFHEIVGLLKPEINAVEMTSKFGSVRRRGSHLFQNVLLVFSSMDQGIGCSKVAGGCKGRTALVTLASLQIDSRKREYLVGYISGGPDLGQLAAHTLRTTGRRRPSWGGRRRTRSSTRRWRLPGQDTSDQQHQNRFAELHGPPAEWMHMLNHRLGVYTHSILRDALFHLTAPTVRFPDSAFACARCSRCTSRWPPTCDSIIEDFQI